MKKFIASTALLALLCACSNSPSGETPKGVKVGKPYSISGKTYYPEYDPGYDRTGIASWYGPGFHGKPTANGEKFNQHALTAAHTTLPMPSMVRVTNLENGKSLIVRINDRGPFKDDRIIDLSKASAEQLGIKGLAKVRVQYLVHETEQHWADLGLTQKDIRFAKNDPNKPTVTTLENPDPVYGFDGMILAKDTEEEPSNKNAAPVLSVAAEDLKGAQVEMRTVSTEEVEAVLAGQDVPQPPPISKSGRSIGFISDAYAAEDVPPKPVHSSEPQVVNLFTESGKMVGKNGQPMKVLKVEEELYKKPEEKYTLLHPASVDVSLQNHEIVDNSLSAPPASIPTGTWYIQAGSFASYGNASKLAENLGDIGKVDLSTVKVKGKDWHRVRLGPFATRGDANHALRQVESYGASGAKIVQD